MHSNSVACRICGINSKVDFLCHGPFLNLTESVASLLGSWGRVCCAGQTKKYMSCRRLEKHDKYGRRHTVTLYRKVVTVM
jgi:hypothetical protein